MISHRLRRTTVLLASCQRRDSPNFQLPIPVRKVGELHATSNPLREFPLNSGRIFSKSALPNQGHSPAGVQECLDIPLIPSPIGGKLFLPEIRSSVWNSKPSTIFMAVPKTTIDEYNSCPLRENDVRPTDEGSGVQAKSESVAPQHGAHRFFGRRMLGPNARHQRRSNAWFHGISHSPFSISPYESNPNI